MTNRRSLLKLWALAPPLMLMSRDIGSSAIVTLAWSAAAKKEARIAALSERIKSMRLRPLLCEAMARHDFRDFARGMHAWEREARAAMCADRV